MTEHSGQRFGVVDVHYPAAGGARAALLVAAERRFATIVGEHVARLDLAAPYRPGSFYTRELPAIRAVLDTVPALDLLVIDGYVDLDPGGRPGLGARLHDDVGIPVVGVAKTRFRSATHAIPVRRGVAVRPLYVTAAGITAEWAATVVAEMTGPHRLPDALRRVDLLARSDDR